MADPYHPYTSYSTPTPSGVGYYPPEDQHYQHQQLPYSYQQQYGSAEPAPDPNYTYPSQPSPYHLAPGPPVYQGAALERSYTPVGQPDYLGPVKTAGMPPSPGGKIPENLGYYGYPVEQPPYSPSASPHPPSVFVSEADGHSSRRDDKPSSDQADDSETERGVGSSLAGGAAGYFLGHKKDHGLLGALGGAIIGNFLENKMKDHGRHSHGHGHGHGHGHHHHHHHHRHRHGRSRSHSRHRGDDDL